MRPAPSRCSFWARRCASCTVREDSGDWGEAEGRGFGRGGGWKLECAAHPARNQGWGVLGSKPAIVVLCQRRPPQGPWPTKARGWAEPAGGCYSDCSMQNEPRSLRRRLRELRHLWRVSRGLSAVCGAFRGDCVLRGAFRAEYAVYRAFRAPRSPSGPPPHFYALDGRLKPYRLHRLVTAGGISWDQTRDLTALSHKSSHEP